MKIYGNKFGTSFEYFNKNRSTNLRYGKDILLYAQDTNNSNYIEVGVTGAYIDMRTKFIFYLQDGITKIQKTLPQPILTYTPGLYSEDLNTQDDVNLLSGLISDFTIGTNQHYGKSLQAATLSSHWKLGKYNKAIWFGENDPFLIEFVYQTVPNFNLGRLLDIGFDQSAFAGIKFERNSLYGYKFSWGDGSSIKSIQSNVLENFDFNNYLHLGIIRTSNPDRISFYVEGQEVAYYDNPGSINQALLYAGQKNPVFMENIFGNLRYAKIAVGDVDPTDFSFMAYAKDGNGNYNISPYFMSANTPYSFALDYQCGGLVKDIEIFNQSESIHDYTVEIDTGFSNFDKVFFENLDGTPLPFFAFNNKHYVKIPYIATSGIVTIRAIERDNNYVVPTDIINSTLSYDDFSKFDRHINNSNTLKLTYTDPNLSLSNITYSLQDFDGLFISHIKNNSASEAVAYFITDLIPSTYQGYKVLFGLGASTEVSSNAVMGVSLFPNQPIPGACINIVTSIVDQNLNIAGSYFGGDYLSFKQYATGSEPNNIGIVNSGNSIHYYELKFNENLDVSLNNITLGSGINFNATGLIPEMVFSNRVGFFIASNGSDVTPLTRWQFKPMYIIPYIDNEPIVTVSNTAYELKSFSRLFINGEQQF